MIAIQNIIHTDKALLTIIFNRNVRDHLQCKCDDYIVVLQSTFNARYFLLIKSDNGYRIKKYPYMKNTFQVQVGFKFPYLSEFDLTECIYFLKKNNTVRILIK